MKKPSITKKLGLLQILKNCYNTMEDSLSNLQTAFSYQKENHAQTKIQNSDKALLHSTKGRPIENYDAEAEFDKLFNLLHNAKLVEQEIGMIMTDSAPKIPFEAAVNPSNESLGQEDIVPTEDWHTENPDYRMPENEARELYDTILKDSINELGTELNEFKKELETLKCE